MQPHRSRFVVEGPYALVDSLRMHRFGRPDPTVMIDTSAQRYAKCAHTPLGPVTLVAWQADGVEVALYGPGAEWLAPRLREMLGLDDPADFAPAHPRLLGWRRAFRATRLVQAISLAEQHAVLILQQRITFTEAARSWRAMCLRLDRRAPGPLPLWLPPTPADWLALPQPHARALEIDAHRWQALHHASRAAAEVESRRADRTALSDYLMAIPGTGPWTTGLMRGLGTGDADAIVLGDVHMPHDVSALLTDVPHGSDDKMVELLEPFRPHRFRVVRVMLGSGRRRP